MARATHPCPECGSSERKQEPGEYALIGLKNGRLSLHVDKPNEIDAVVVTASICGGCGLVSLHEST